MEKMRNPYKILDGILEGKIPHARRRSRWDDIKWILMKQYMRVWAVFIWLSTATSDELTVINIIRVP
jgi:hypothetical protein